MVLTWYMFKDNTDRKINHIFDFYSLYCKNDYNTQGNLQIQWNPYQITNGIFHRTITKN